MHPIKQYIEKNEIDQKSFAKMAGLSEGYISQIINGNEKCGREAALKILGVAGDEIDILDLMTWEVE